ncbi:hypothetical protein TRFO_13698 [Tritrichomonas foetus]|uniref:Protein kinase domain-containing protein n=1 Tax=Tritrichomonas foetus TaxID=1144522 RepID=A0A1J4KX85_9EUKA|nr:hypothetical protein TRFO_13698 [Tritrichomonas foetus]|eukprot:OHT15867.1 hypothetical protein TRFO_13698 [Tritrichomonas foetus]
MSEAPQYQQCPPNYECLMGAMNFQFLEVIGGRNFGTTSRERNKKNGTFVTFKTIPSFFIERRMSNVGILSIVYQFSKLFHPAIATIQGVIFPDRDCTSHYRFVGEYYERGSLADLYNGYPMSKSPDFWTPTRKAIIAFGIAAGMQFLQHTGYTHGYLTPSNVVFDRNFHPHVNDFWYNIFIPEKNQRFITGPYSIYSAPERFRLEQQTNRGDVFSYGMILFELAYDFPLIDNDKYSQQKILSMVYSNELKSPYVTPKLQRLIFKCLSLNPIDRPSFDYVVGSFFDDHDPLFAGTNFVEFSVYRLCVLQNHIYQMSHVNTFDTGNIPVLPQNAEYLRRYAEMSGNPKALYQYGKLTNNYDFIKIAADKGNKSAQFWYSTYLENTNKEESMKYLVASADQNHVKALEKLAELTNSDEHLKRAADLGSPRAQVKFALKTNHLYYLKMAADKHDSEALYLLAKHEETGSPLHFDEEDAKIPITMKMNPNDAFQFLNEKTQSVIYKNLCSAIIHYNEAAVLNNSDAISRLESISSNGSKLVTRAESIFKQNDPKKVDELIMYALMILAGCFSVERNVHEASRILSLAAQITNNPDAQFQLYDLFNKPGIKIEAPKNSDEAITYLKNSAYQGHTKAALQFGQYLFAASNYSINDFIEQGTIKYFRHAANMGDVDAMVTYANFVQTIKGLESPTNESALYYKLAASRGSLPAQFNYGQLLELGAGIPHNIPEALYYYKLAAKQGYGGAMLAIAQLYDQHKELNIDEREIMKRYLIAGSHGESRAMYIVGERYSYGQGVEIDIQRALLYYQIASFLGDMSAQFKYGDYLVKSYMNAPEYVTEGFAFLLLALSQENNTQESMKIRILASQSLAKLFMNKKLKIYNLKKARFWFQESLKLGDFEALTYIGDIYHMKGKFPVAFGAYSTGQQEGVMSCYSRLAKYYENGIVCGKDLKKAAEYYEIAGETNQKYFLNAAKVYDQIKLYDMKKNQLSLKTLRINSKKDHDSNKNQNVDDDDYDYDYYDYDVDDDDFFNNFDDDFLADVDNKISLLYTKSIPLNDTKRLAHLRMGQILLECKSPTDVKMAEALLQESAKYGNPDAFLALSTITNNPDSKSYYIKQAAKYGNPKAKALHAMALIDSNPSKALRLLWEAKSAKEPEAFMKIAELCETGRVLQRDISRAINLYITADVLHHPTAKSNAIRLIHVLNSGISDNHFMSSPFFSEEIKKLAFNILYDIEKKAAIEKLRNMAIRGNWQAQIIIGHIYSGCENVPRNLDLAIECFRYAINAEINEISTIEAMIKLASILVEKGMIDSAFGILDLAKSKGSREASILKIILTLTGNSLSLNDVKFDGNHIFTKQIKFTGIEKNDLKELMKQNFSKQLVQNPYVMHNTGIALTGGFENQRYKNKDNEINILNDIQSSDNQSYYSQSSDIQSTDIHSNDIQSIDTQLNDNFNYTENGEFNYKNEETSIDDIERGLYYLHESADKTGDPYLQFSYAKELIAQNPDDQIAIHYLEMSANQGCTEAARLLVKINDGKDSQTVSYYVKMGADLGDRYLMFRRAKELIELGEMHEAKHLLMVVARSNGRAAYLLALLYEEGEKLKKNYQKAFDYYNAASALGIHISLERMGYLLAVGGFGLAQDEKRALHIIRKASCIGIGKAVFTVSVNQEFKDYIAKVSKPSHRFCEIIEEEFE